MCRFLMKKTKHFKYSARLKLIDIPFLMLNNPMFRNVLPILNFVSIVQERVCFATNRWFKNSKTFFSKYKFYLFNKKLLLFVREQQKQFIVNEYS